MMLLDKHINKSVLVVGLISLLIISFVLVSVSLFMNLESFIQNDISFFEILYYCLLCFPDAINKSLGISFLFSITYFLSITYSNNEIIALYNAGFSLNRIKAPIYFTAIIIVIFAFVFNEFINIPVTKQKDLLYNKLIGYSSSLDNRDVTITDQQNNFIIYAKNYFDNKQEISKVTIVFTDTDHNLQRKIVSEKGDYTSAGTWDFINNTIYTIKGNEVEITYEDNFIDPRITTNPSVFKNLTNDIKTMKLSYATEYLQKIRFLDPQKYTEVATDFYQRIFNCLIPLIMIIIACSVNYKFKKNVLLFSIFSCLCIAVVFYVVQMLTIILAKQGILAPAMGSLIPFLFILLFAALFNWLLRKI